MKDNKKKVMGIFALFVLTILIATSVYAQVTTTPTGGDRRVVTDVLGCLVCRVFQIIFYIAGAIAALVILIAGIKWTGSGDDPSARSAAKSTVIHAIIGLIIVLISASLVVWIISSVTTMMIDPTEFLTATCSTCPTTSDI